MTAPGRLAGIVIELGEEHGVLPPGPEDGYRIRPVHRRFAGLAATLVLALLAGGASVWPGAPLRLVARVAITTGVASLLVDGDTMVVLGDGTYATAYALPGGARRWRTPLDLSPQYGSMVATDGVVLVSSGESGTGEARTVGVDERSGTALWTDTGEIYTPLTGTGTVLLQPTRTSVLELVDVRTGEVRWTVSTANCQVTFDETDVIPLPAVSAEPETRFPHAFAQLCPDGTLSIVALPSGDRHTVHLPPVSSVFGNPPRQLATAGPVLIVDYPDGQGSTIIDGYRWADGGLAWRRPGFGLQDNLSSCGGDVCVQNQDVDLALADTGAQTPIPDFRSGPRATTVDTRFGADALVVVPQGRSPRDALTLEPTQVYALPARIGMWVQSLDAADPAYLIGRPLVGVVTAGGGVRLLQYLPGVNASRCVVVTAYLACPTDVDQITIWQYPTG